MNNNTTHKRIAKSAMLMTIVSVISLAFSFVQESVFAFFYGANFTTDAYTVATQIPVTLFALISTAISTIVIPCYSKELYGKGKGAAARYASNLTTIIGGVTILCIIVGEIFAKYIIILFAPGMEADIQSLAVKIFRIVLPTIIFTEIMNINSGILNVHKSFILPSLTSNILNVIFVLSIALLSGKYGIYAAVIGTLVGIGLEFIYSVILRRRILKYRFIVDLKDRSMIESIKMSIPVFIGIGAAEINKIVDRIVSSFLQEGSISTLNYASKLSGAVSSLLVTSVTTVIYPEFSKSSAKKDEKSMADIFLFSIKIFIILITPIIFGGMFLSREIIKVLYGRGAFDLRIVDRTAPLFACYLVCLLFTTFRQTSSRVFYSYGDSKTPMKNSMIGIVINIILNIVLGHYLGTMGLALATTIATAVISFLLLYDVKNKNTLVKYKSIYFLFTKVIIASIVMEMVLQFTKKILIYLKIYNYSVLWNNIIFILLELALGCIVYLGMLIMLQTKEIKSIVNVIGWRKE